MTINKEELPNINNEIVEHINNRIKYISKKLSCCIGYSKIEKAARINELKFLLEEIEKRFVR